MKNPMYSTDIIWYDENVYNAIMSLDNKYPNAIPVFGGALSAHKCINCDNPNLEQFISFLPDIAHNAIFYKWHEDVAHAIRRFCNLCFVDPALIEAYIGAPLEDVF